MATIIIENTYDDGHECITTIDIADPDPRDEEAMENFWDQVHDETGCGCRVGGRPEGNSYYIATIVDADNPALVRKSMEWN